MSAGIRGEKQPAAGPHIAEETMAGNDPPGVPANELRMMGLNARAIQPDGGMLVARRMDLLFLGDMDVVP
jgi:hypothetical protein